MIAHIRKTDDIYQEQSVPKHCRETADLCAGYAAAVCAENIGKIQGLLHDVGKMTSEFECYILGKTNLRQGEIDHSYAGAKYLCEFSDERNIHEFHDISRLIARTIISHHGLHNWLDSNDKDYFSERIRKEKGYREVLSHIGEIIRNAELSDLLKKSAEEYSRIKSEIKQLSPDKVSYAFYLGMLERFFESCLIDADRVNTADFMSGVRTENHYDTKTLWEKMSVNMRDKLDSFSFLTDNISKQRRSIADRCAAFAEHTVKACRLIVPTGGGKTLSSLRFAIEYCRRHGKEKIFYIAPFMSILEQNSDIIRSIAGDENFAEHHSNILADIETENELHEYELRTEKWDSPVIAATMVRFLNALFSGKSSDVRRMHRLSNAVIIIDEVQSVPLKCVYLFNLAVNFLTHICGRTVVLCSATQPAVEELKFPLILDDNSSMTGDTAQDFEVFRRTEIIPELSPYGFSYDEAADFCADKFGENGNLLIIVNTKAAAKQLFEKIKERFPDIPVIHLSTNLCPEHRREKINEMKTLLNERKPLICVTTQLIEAGVDISFGCVVRSLAGLDNAAQAAGRCNRNGEFNKICPVYLIFLRDENVGRLENVQTAHKITRQITNSPEINDYLSDHVQKLYFQKLYHDLKSKLSYPVKIDDMNRTLLELLSLNISDKSCKDLGLPLSIRYSIQAFRTAGSLFEVIDSRTKDIIVPYNDDARKLIKRLNDELSPAEYSELLRKAQKYTVGIYEGQKRKLSENNAVYPLACGAFALEERFYDENCGLITEGAEQELLMF